MLLGLLLPSANNFADSLGRWVSGDVGAFVARLNATATQLGMRHTHYADPSGFSPQTVASASDLVILGTKALQVPALAALVATQHAQLPDGTQLDNLDSLLGSVPGWLGIKTGNTDQAGGCLLFAARRPVGGGQVTLVGAVLGQTDLAAALDAARSAVETGFSGYAVVQASDAPVVSGSVVSRWGERSEVDVASVQSNPEGVPIRMGTVLHLSVVGNAVQGGALPAGSAVATVLGDDGAGLRLRWEMVTRSAMAGPSFWWMLFQN
jgi:D-alanyl-D-alanine carboxypeptidase (penicillin-binding protein 5/6)